MRPSTWQHRTLILTLSALLAAGCSSSSSEAPGEVLQSDKQRITSPQVSSSDLDTQVAGHTAFAFDLYQQVRANEKGNLFYSPHSISIALAMTYAGAANNTEQEMGTTLHFDLPQSKLHPACNKLDLELSSRGQGAKAADGKAFRLNVINSIWGQQDFEFLPSFLDTLAVNYGAGLRLLDFIGDTEGSRLAINGWVEQQTEERIKDLIPSGMLSPLSRLVLVNAIYFNAAWRDQFKEENTQDQDFTLGDGSKVKVPTMSGGGTWRYAQASGYQAVEIPYDGNELSMLILLPDGELDAFEAGLSDQTLSDTLAALKSQEVELLLPKFEFDASLMLKKTLSAMGMSEAFNEDKADFSAMTTVEPLHIGEVIHKAFIKVDEKGTEAAAATAVIMDAGTAMPPEPVVVAADRPFFFLIRDHQTDAVLFVGRVADPR